MSANTQGVYNQDIIKAVRSLYGQGVINKDKDIADKTGYKKSTVSGYISGKVDASPGFRKKFEEVFELKLSDFAETAAVNKITPSQMLSTEGVSVTLQDYINLLHRENERLYNIVNSSLGRISADQQVALAYQKAWVEYEADRASEGDAKKKKEIMYKMGKLVDGMLQNGASKGSPEEIDKKSKG